MHFPKVVCSGFLFDTSFSARREASSTNHFAFETFSSAWRATCAANHNARNTALAVFAFPWSRALASLSPQLLKNKKTCQATITDARAA